jgi:hypothetical protein
MKEPVLFRDEVVLAIYRRELTEHGGASGIRDDGQHVGSSSKLWAQPPVACGLQRHPVFSR